MVELSSTKYRWGFNLKQVKRMKACLAKGIVSRYMNLNAQFTGKIKMFGALGKQLKRM